LRTVEGKGLTVHYLEKERLMRWRTLLVCCVALIALGTGIVQASDRTGIYALVEKVVLEPGPDKPETIQVWGVFSVADPKDINRYEQPVKGYLYFTVLKGKEDLSRKEWADLKSVAGKGQVVGFSSRWEQKVRVRKPTDKPEAPDNYTISFGTVKMNPNTGYAPVRSLLDFK
jgi:hypothetical protein